MATTKKHVKISMTLAESWSLLSAASRVGTTPERYAYRLLMNALDAAWLEFERSRGAD
jgi:hypothetical protein